MLFFILMMTPFFACLTALSARRQIAAAPPLKAEPFDSAFNRGLSCIIAVHLPVAGYFYYAFPDWSLGYLVPATRMPLGFGIALAAIIFNAFFFFYLATQALIRARRPLTAMIATSQVGLLALIFAAIFAEELTHVGSYFAFHAGDLKPLTWGTGLLEIIIGILFFSVSGTVVLFMNARDDRAYPTLELEDSKW